jgi:hypothetical protein
MRVRWYSASLSAAALISLVVVLLGGFAVNGIWCLYLNAKNKTTGDYTKKDTPLVGNLLFAGLAGAIVLAPPGSAVAQAVQLIGLPECRLNLAQGFNSIGTTTGPLIAGYLIFKYFARTGAHGAESVRMPYLWICLVFLALAGVFWFVHLPHIGVFPEMNQADGADIQPRPQPCLFTMYIQVPRLPLLIRF